MTGCAENVRAPDGKHEQSERTHLESRPRTRRLNLPKPKPPSLGWPRSFTPQDLMTSIQLRTRSSSLRDTKSKKLRPMHAVVEMRLSFEQ